MKPLPLLSLLAFAACSDKKPPPADAAVPPATISTTAADSAPGAPAPAGTGIVFDPGALSKGTRVGTLEADMLTLSRTADSGYTGQARFAGEVTLSGRAIPHVDANVREVCFEPDAASAALLPRWAGDTRRTWFCFSNQPEAQQLLAALREVRPATVVIDRFTINKGGSDQENSAELVRVVTRGEPVPR